MVHGRGGGEEGLVSETGNSPARQFHVFARRTSLGVWCGVLFLILVIAGCGQAPPASAPIRDTLVIGVPEAVSGANTGLRNLASTLSVEGLTQVRSDGRAVPKLAERWEWEDGGRALRIFLRQGVTFHDGAAVTATLAASVLTDLVSQPGNRALFPSLQDVTEIAADGELVVVVRLSRPSAFLVEDLELPLQIGAERSGTGPYRVVSASPTEIRLERFEQYYLGAPQIRLVTLKSQGALRTAWSALLRGEVDMITDVPPDAVQFISGDDVEVVSFRRPYQYAIAFNSRRGPFANPVVRRALNLAVDRGAIIDNVLSGQGIPSTGPLWPQHWAYDRSLAPFNADAAAAASLLDAEGFPAKSAPDGPPRRFRFTCLVPQNFSVMERIILDIQKQLYGVGVDMQVEVVPPEHFDARIRSGDFDATFIDIAGGPSLGRAYVFWGSAKSFAGLNLFGYENAEAERLFGILRTTTNEAAVRSATSALQRVLLSDPPALFIAWNERSRAVRRDFHIVEDSKRGFGDPIYTIWQWAPAGASSGTP